MGSFNVGCGISNLAIQGGDAIGFVILSKNSGRERRDSDVGFSTYIYPDDLFKPYAPPVFGQYGDYGLVEEIEPSKTTELLENMFSRPIKDIIDCISCGGGVYDSGRIYEHYFTGSKKFMQFGASNETALTELGFTKEPSGHSEEIYRMGKYEIVGRLSDIHELLLLWTISDTEKDEVLVPEFMSQFTSAVLNQFSKATGLFPGYDEKDWGTIQTLADLYGMYFLKDAFAGMKAHHAKDEFYFPSEKAAYEKMWLEFLAGLLVIKRHPEEFSETLIQGTELARFVSRSTGFPVEKIKELISYGESHEFFEIGYLRSIMISLNRMFMPSYCGTQDGDTDASLALNTITNSILRGRKSDYED